MEETPTSKRDRRGYRSLFWPVLFIGLGIAWLLSNLGLIPQTNLLFLARLWPVLLIVAGIDILLARRLPLLGALLGVLVVGTALGVAAFAPSLGYDLPQRSTSFGIFFAPTEVKSETFNEPLNDATSADIEIDFNQFGGNVEALPAGSPDLIDATIYYLDEADFSVHGNAHRSVLLQTRTTGLHLGDFDHLLVDNAYRWQVGLSPDVPMDLLLDASSGSITADLGALDLRSLNIDASSGRLEATLPASSSRYPATVTGSSGSMHLEVAAGAETDIDLDASSGHTEIAFGDSVSASLTINASSGGIDISTPQDAAVRVVSTDSSSGSLNLGSRFEQVDEGDEDPDTGTWETPNYDRADYQIEVIIDSMSSGSIRVH